MVITNQDISREMFLMLQHIDEDNREHHVSAEYPVLGKQKKKNKLSLNISRTLSVHTEPITWMSR